MARKDFSFDNLSKDLQWLIIVMSNIHTPAAAQVLGPDIIMDFGIRVNGVDLDQESLEHLAAGISTRIDEGVVYALREKLKELEDLRQFKHEVATAFFKDQYLNDGEEE